MTIHDKELLVEELEEHLAQVKAITLRNPFMCLCPLLGSVVLTEELTNDCGLGGDYVHYRPLGSVIRYVLEIENEYQR